MSEMMDAFISSETYENAAYLSTGNGRTWRVWFHWGGQPLMELLTPSQEQELAALRKRYPPQGDRRIIDHRGL